MRLPSCRLVGPLLLPILFAGCTLLPGKQPPPGEGETTLPESTRPASPTPLPGPLPVPSASAPSPALYRVGWKSDVAEFLYGPPGQRWIVAAGGRAETLRGTLRLRPDGKAAATFAVQLGAFSSEESAKSTLDRLSAELATPGVVAFSADRGVYRVLLGRFPDRASAELFAQNARQAGHEALVAEGSAVASGPAAPASVVLSGEDGVGRRLASPVDISPAEPESRVLLDGKPYRGSLRISVNARGLLNVVNLVNLEEYLYGVVPSEMGPKRYDEIEALKAQAVAARTYALAHRGQFEAEGYDICATPKCQVYGGLSAEDPLSTAAVEATRGLVLAHGGQLADALFISTCGGRTENVENAFGERPEPYLVSVECGELETTALPGAPLERGKTAGVARSGLSWRGYVLRRHIGRRAAPRAAELDLAQQWAGVVPGGAAPERLTPAAVYPSIVTAFGLTEAGEIHLLPRDQRYYGETPPVSGHLSAAAAQAYDFLIRFRFGAGEPLPPADATLAEEDYAGLLFSAALRLSGVTEGSGRFLRREGANLWVKTAEGRLGLPVDPELPLARRVGDRYLPSPTLTLRAGDRLHIAPLLRTGVPESVWPAVPSQSAAAVLAQLYQLEQTQWLDGRALLERQLVQLAHLTAYARRHSPFWQEVFDRNAIDANEPWSEERLRTVPLLTRQALVEQSPRINCNVVPPAHEPSANIQTSGSTGQIVKVKRTNLNNLMWMALAMRDHFWHRRDFRQSSAFIRANVQAQDNDAVALKEGWGPPVTLLFQSGPSYRQPLSLSVGKQAAWLLRRNPYYLLTYPTNLNALLDEFVRTGQVPSALREVRCIGETLSGELKARCEKEFALRTVDGYSAQEVGVIALQCPVSGFYHVQAESLIVEVLNDDGAPCKEGEIGRVVVTDLHNFATPILRYELRDYAEVGGACPCGRGLPVLKRILGRRRNMVTLPDGSKHWPTLGFHAFRDIAPIRQYQAVQSSLDTVEIKLVVDHPLAGEPEARLRAVIQEALGYPFTLQFSYHASELPKTRGGKFEEFISTV